MGKNSGKEGTRIEPKRKTTWMKPGSMLKPGRLRLVVFLSARLVASPDLRLKVSGLNQESDYLRLEKIFKNGPFRIQAFR